MRAGVGHIGSALSIADVVDVLYRAVLVGVGSESPDRDVFILSKGHAALAVYCALHLRGIIDPDALNTYCADGSLLGVHPEHQLRGIEFSTGSLGQGLSLGCGVALGRRPRHSTGRTYVLLSDAELDEGSTWEAVMFASHHLLGGLTAIVDLNGQQALGHTDDVISLGDVAERFRAFGWAAVEVDGHDQEALELSLCTPRSPVAPPRVIVAHTVSGKGVSFMEGQVAWHYLPLSEAQYCQALSELSL